MLQNLIIPDWPAPVGVRALSTTRSGGVSKGAWAGLNLGDHVGDDPLAVAKNRLRLRQLLPGEPCWLQQVHGTTVVTVDRLHTVMAADASVAVRQDTVCAVLTADCLPVLLCDDKAQVVAAAHAGWRGLLAGVLEQTLVSMSVNPHHVLAWIGPGIGAEDYEVGDDVRQAFVQDLPEAISAFRARPNGKWLADMPLLAGLRLNRAGVSRVYGGVWSTYADPERFYSYRRDGVTGRMASLIWLSGDNHSPDFSGLLVG